MIEESVKINRFTLEGEPMVDIRWWKETRVGPRPTAKGMVISQKLVTRLIAALWKVHEMQNSEEAKKAVMAKG